MTWTFSPSFMAGLSIAIATYISALNLSAEESQISVAKDLAGGWLMHEVSSEYQAAPTKINVLLPREIKAGERLAVLYVLPVEEGDGLRWGNPLEVIRELDLANRRRVICVYPTFAHLPWYCDHPTNPKIRQETFFLKVVLPFVEKTYPALTERHGRYLLGFSKSGYGAWSLLLRNPQLFERAVAWDAPLVVEQPTSYGMAPIYGTAENFAGYSLIKLLKNNAEQLRQSEDKRLIHIGYGNFRNQHEQAEKLLVELKVPHIYHDGPQLKHAWDSGWVEQAAELVLTGQETEKK